VDDMNEYLARAGVDAEVIDLGTPMTTAQAAADNLGVPVSQIFKSLVLTDDEGGAYVAVLPGDDRLDQKALCRLVGKKRLKFAQADVVLARTGYPAGGTPPIGHRDALPVYVDEKVMAFEFGYGGGGRHELLLKIRPAEMVRASAATVAKLGQ
jgi:Cys-tRNA(Pro)/Cys-tRNA(Cys) deacylase